MTGERERKRERERERERELLTCTSSTLAPVGFRAACSTACRCEQNRFDHLKTSFLNWSDRRRSLVFPSSSDELQLDLECGLHNLSLEWNTDSE